MKKTTPFIFLVLLGLLLAACAQGGQPLPPPTSTLPPEVVQAATSPAPTVEPSPTPQTGKILLISPTGIDSQPYQSLIEELAVPSGWLVENRAGLSTAELTADVRVVLMLAPLANYAELLAAAPQVQFVIYSPVDLTAAANLSVIRQRAELQVFVAGFISELLSPDYRAAGLLPSDGFLGAQLQEAFVNGGRYYCGPCAPGWPLGLYYPAVGSLPAASDGAAWLGATADLYGNKMVDVFFLSPDSIRPEVTTYLQGKTQLDRPVLIVGAQAPLDGFSNQWAASVRFDDLSALRQVWPDIAAGQGGALVDAPLLVDHVNDALLSPGRMRLVDELLTEINAERVNPFTIAP